MTELPLKEFVSGLTQEAAAKKIGVTQSGLSQMLRSDRRIFVHIDEKTGEFIEAFEVRPIGSPTAA
ncbi:Cro/CI family transcriptional regulator [Oceanisphaera sp. KMM 10153]|uniref:Cro/CI family transcriptional regulator n=1 Tax=Oceanisphaera submarina TaxID=3390193 RepID=UPI003974A5A2